MEVQQPSFGLLVALQVLHSFYVNPHKLKSFVSFVYFIIMKYASCNLRLRLSEEQARHCLTAPTSEKETQPTLKQAETRNNLSEQDC